MFLLHVSFTSIRAKCEETPFSGVSCLLNVWQIFLVKEQGLRNFNIHAKIKDNLSYFAFIFISDFMGFFYACMSTCVCMCIYMCACLHVYFSVLVCVCVCVCICFLSHANWVRSPSTICTDPLTLQVDDPVRLVSSLELQIALLFLFS